MWVFLEKINIFKPHTPCKIMHFGFLAYIEQPKQGLEIKIDSQDGTVQIGDSSTTLQHYQDMKWVLTADMQILEIRYNSNNLDALLADMGRLTTLIKDAGFEMNGSELAVVFKGATITAS
jgi:hypothetical protein